MVFTRYEVVKDKFKIKRFSTSGRRDYEKELKRRQEEHLKKVSEKNDLNWIPCLHDNCELCYGTGVKSDGTTCFHYISCSCPKCSPSYF